MEGFPLLDTPALISAAIFSREKNTTAIADFANQFRGFSCFKIWVLSVLRKSWFRRKIHSNVI